MFKSSNICLLNPSFGEGSKLVGGADADFIINDMIVDIKTTMKLQQKRDHINQLLGYYILHEISGAGEYTPKLKITKIGVYFSRFAYLHVLDLDEIISKKSFPNFIEWFVDQAKQK